MTKNLKPKIPPLPESLKDLKNEALLALLIPRLEAKMVQVRQRGGPQIMWSEVGGNPSPTEGQSVFMEEGAIEVSLRDLVMANAQNNKIVAMLNFATRDMKGFQGEEKSDTEERSDTEEMSDKNESDKRAALVFQDKECREIINALCLKNMNLIKSCARNAKEAPKQGSGKSWDEFLEQYVQEVSPLIFTVAIKFDPSKAGAFSTLFVTALGNFNTRGYREKVRTDPVLPAFGLGGDLKPPANIFEVIASEPNIANVDAADEVAPLKAPIQNAWETLNPKQQELLKRLLGKNIQTYESAGRELGEKGENISSQRVGQIREDALRNFIHELMNVLEATETPLLVKIREELKKTREALPEKRKENGSEMQKKVIKALKAEAIERLGYIIDQALELGWIDSSWVAPQKETPVAKKPRAECLGAARKDINKVRNGSHKSEEKIVR